MVSSTVRRARQGDVEVLSRLAAETFPLACPPGLPEADIAAFVARHLSLERFRDYLAQPSHIVLVHDGDGDIDGYIVMMVGDEFQPEPSSGVTRLPSAYLSKCYVRASSHGGATAGALMDRAKQLAAGLGAASIWLNTNQANARAIRFYEKHGFVAVGTKEMVVGQQVCSDYVFECALTPTPGPATSR